MKRIVSVALVCLAFGAGMAFAQLKKHPNLEAAFKHLKEAEEKITAAQKANEYDMEGHAQKAKDLISQAIPELEKAAHAATENTGKK